MPSNGSQHSEKGVASLLAATTDLGTNAAVLVMLRMALTLFGAGEAGCSAASNDGSDQPRVRCGLSDRDAAGRLADVGAVEADANHASQLLEVGLA
jgi:hypothetical protein